MPAFDASGPVFGDPIIVLGSGTRTASATGTATPTGSYNTLRLVLNVTAASGTTPNLVVAVETSGDGTTWTAIASFTAATATGTQRKVFSGVDRFVRANYTISGTTPSFTFDVTGMAV